MTEAAVRFDYREIAAQARGIRQFNFSRRSETNARATRFTLHVQPVTRTIVVSLAAVSEREKEKTGVRATDEKEKEKLNKSSSSADVILYRVVYRDTPSPHRRSRPYILQHADAGRVLTKILSDGYQ